MVSYTIGKVAHLLTISVDTLRYYEKIGLLPKISRTESGARRYQDKDLSRLKFIKEWELNNLCIWDSD